MNHRYAVRTAAALFVIPLLFSACGTSSVEPETQTDTAFVTEAPSAETDLLPDRKYSETAVTVEMRNDPAEFGVDQGALDTISEYFRIYYSSLGSLKSGDISRLFSFDTDIEQLLHQAMIDYQIMIRDSRDIDLTYGECTVGLTFREVAESNGRTVIRLYENNYADYSFAGGVTSYTSGVEHTFTLEGSQTGRYIVSHSEISGVYKLLTDKFDSICEEKRLTRSSLTKNQISDVIDSLNRELVSAAENGLYALYERKNAFNDSPSSFAVGREADNSYDASAAVAYSYEWAGKYDMKRNPAFAVYDDFGGNCNNFTSQCLFAGGLPMDTRGDIYNQWKYYGSDISGYNGRVGRSMSWTGVEDFYNYCRTNEGPGPVTEISDNVYCARPGDIVQYVSGGVGVHSVIVSQVVCDEDGKVVELLINSNTTDKVDCPMSIYGYTDFRLIRIIGWNN